MNRAAILALGVATLACAREPVPLALRVDTAIERARAWLVEQQDDDGTWRSQVYGNLKDGWSLTLPAAKALLYAPDPAARGALAAALERIASAPGPAGRIDAAALGLGYPVYTSALAVIALSKSGEERHARARDAWLALLREHQLDEGEGWDASHASYGGWGYAIRPPRPESADGSAFEADVSSTVFALGALRAAGVAHGDPAVQRALRFVTRCQNWPLAGAAPDARLDDGGFFFTPANEFQNKAGQVGPDANGRVRHRSYGSATADGVRALLACGLERTDPRVSAARAWLERNFTALTNPGDFAGVRAVEREATWTYWCWSAAHALTQLGVERVARPGAVVDWRDEIAEALIARQRPDGTWSNPYTMVKEDDPLVATPLAMGALALCRLRSPEGASGR